MPISSISGGQKLVPFCIKVGAIDGMLYRLVPAAVFFLTNGVRGKKFMFYNSATIPQLSGCVLSRFGTAQERELVRE